ncbi:MAG: GtrA family protein [Clostridia bacterium]|nr:GtrA family protein [Clostridia bacterium]
MQKIKQLIEKLLSIQFIKFGLVGCLNTLVDLIVFTLLNAIFHIYYLAKIVSYSCGVLNSYFFNTRWTFQKEHKKSAKEFILFVVINLISLGVSLGMLYVCRNLFMIRIDFISNVIATVVSLVVNFIGNKLIVFRTEKEES